MPSYLEKIKAGTANVRTIKYPGAKANIDIHVLSNQDMLDAALATDELFRKSGTAIQMHNINDYETELDTQRMFRSCREPNTKNPIAATITEFRAHMTPAERAAIIEEYNALDADCNPSPAAMPDGEFDALVNRLKKNPQSAIGSVSNISTLRRLCLFLASPPATSPTDSGPISS